MGIIRSNWCKGKQNCAANPVILQNSYNPTYFAKPAKEQRVLTASQHTSLVLICLSLPDLQTTFCPLPKICSHLSYLFFCSFPLALHEEQFHSLGTQAPNSPLSQSAFVLFLLPMLLHHGHQLYQFDYWFTPQTSQSLWFLQLALHLSSASFVALHHGLLCSVSHICDTNGGPALLSIIHLRMDEAVVQLQVR